MFGQPWFSNSTLGRSGTIEVVAPEPSSFWRPRGYNDRAPNMYPKIIDSKRLSEMLFAMSWLSSSKSSKTQWLSLRFPSKRKLPMILPCQWSCCYQWNPILIWKHIWQGPKNRTELLKGWTRDGMFFKKKTSQDMHIIYIERYRYIDIHTYMYVYIYVQYMI